jgi:hypothetical protein
MPSNGKVNGELERIWKERVVLEVPRETTESLA